MEIIASHVNTDFDALGSMVGARLLYPRAWLVLAGSQDRNVREFLTLHREFLAARQPQEIDFEAVTRLIVVETQVSRRLGELASLLSRPDLEVILYDHHTAAEGDIKARERHVEATGAATTLLVREIQRRQLPPTPVEATVMLLGIYEDTGSLLFASTTPEDVEAAAFLLRADARLEVVAQFMNRALTQEQQDLLNRLLAGIETADVKGVPVAVAAVDGPYVELALLTHKLGDLVNAGAVFVLAGMEGAVYVVGRCRSEAIDVGEVLAALGGGGHARAASAVLKGVDVHEARARLHRVLAEQVARGPKARDIMSVPVRQVRPEATVAEASRLMLRYGHSGLCVVEEGALIGVITRRDVDKARHHRLTHAPVKAFMNRDVVTAAPETSVGELEALMIEHDVGRLPVLDGGQAIGVVTRTDLLRALHGSRYAEGYRPWGVSEAETLLTERLPARVQELLRQIGAIAGELGMDVYVVGGFVRDLFLRVPNLDIDVLVDGDATRLAEAVATRLEGEMKGHHRFATATVALARGLKIDIAAARSETYARPGALPEVEPSSIQSDLRRRDFTFNAMAIQINPERFGRLFDPYRGRWDLEGQVVRVLHNLSFLEDPTRLFRAIRFETRYRFRMDRQTDALARAAIEGKALESISGERIRAEIYYLLEESRPLGALRRAEELGLLRALSPDLALDSALLERVEVALRWVGRRTKERMDRRLVYLAALCTGMGEEQADALLRRRLRIPEPKAALVLETLRRAGPLLERLRAADLRPSQIYDALRDLPLESLAFLYARAEEPAVEARMDDFLTHLRDVTPAITGADLIALGHAPGPGFGAALRAVLEARLDGTIGTREEELALARQTLEAGR